MLKAGLLGTGIGSSIYASILQTHPNVKPEVVFSQDGAKAKNVKKAFGFSTSTDDWREAVDDSDCDFFIIATPTYSHFSIAKEVLNRGKHLLVVPPMTLDAEEASTIVDLARSKKLIAAVDHQNTYLPIRKYVQKVISEGRIGELTHVHRTLRTKDRLKQQINHVWKYKTGSGGGVMALDLSIDFDFLLRVAGGVDKIQAQTATTLKTKTLPSGETMSVETEDQFLCEVQFHRNITASVQSNHVCPGRQIDEFIFYGTEGVLVLSNNADMIIYSYDDPDKRQRVAIPPGYQIQSVPGRIAYTSNYFMVDLLTSAIFDNSPISPTLDEAIHIQRIVDAAYQSASEQRWVEIGFSPKKDAKSIESTTSKAFVSKIYQ